MSLFQNYTGDLIAAATRTAEQQKMFERCMGTMHLWYGNAHIHIWMMSVVPSYATRKYDERGWCKFEKRVGGIITPSHMALDLGLMEDEGMYNNMFWLGMYNSFANRWSASRISMPSISETASSDIELLNLGCDDTTFLYTSGIVSPQKGGSPHTISYSTQPSDHQSTW